MSGAAIQIEKGVPVPTLNAVRRRYPFAQMEVGDSFLVRADGQKARRARYGTVKKCAYVFTERHGAGRVFTVRQVDDGVRVWRTV